MVVVLDKNILRMERRITPNKINTTSRKSIIVGSVGHLGTKLRIVAIRNSMVVEILEEISTNQTMWNLQKEFAGVIEYFLTTNVVDWWFDTRATKHIYNSRRLFVSYQKVNEPEPMFMGNKTASKIEEKGNFWEASKGNTHDLGSIEEETGRRHNFTRLRWSLEFTMRGDGVAVPSNAIIGTNMDVINQTIKMLHSSFDIKVIGEADVSLGVRIQKNSNEYIFTQSHYIEKTLKKFGHYNDRPVVTPFDPKSTSGYVFTLGGAIVSWKSFKQTMNTRSTMEAEFVALDKAAEEVEWLRSFLEGKPEAHEENNIFEESEEEKVQETEFGVPSGEKVNNQEVPFGHILLLQKKQNKHGEQGGSILNFMEEVVKVGQTMGYNMEGCIKDINDIIESQGEFGVIR
ncbi:retrotransposon protein, putative, ty1-copia subclass [Tanacetum coccineum]